MSITHDLSRLADLHRSGDLSDTEYKQAKARVLNEHTQTDQPPLARALNGLCRSHSDRWLGGVCGGLAQISGIAPWLWRLVFTFFTFFGGAGLLVYLMLWIFVPQEPIFSARQIGP
ncbi:MAG: PspC domain-containing protein [Betaproteobacteria bacterium]|nr:PspC domain-containing protein [Betaproteobacteria bacterium]